MSKITKKTSWGDQLTKLLNKDIKELNRIILSLFCVSFLILVGIISYKVNSSYAIFTDSIKGEKTIELTVSSCKRTKIPANETSEVNEPVLSENMIPVYYDDCEDVWKKADKTNNNILYKWYNYDEKVWANSVTVIEEKREEYKNAKMGTEIPMDDILTMQVWIPRYKYTVWNYNKNVTATSSPQEIQIDFESETVTSGEIFCTDSISGTAGSRSETCEIKSTNETCTDSTCNGKTYTHPAFTFGDKELTGFWVGKFEVSSDINCSAAYNSAIGSGCNLTSIRPVVKPNVYSWVGAMVGTFDYNIRKMNDDDNVYGFIISDDTHVIKNMEWGAVAYLSHSKYGKNSEIERNNHINKTGCGPIELGSTTYGTVCDSYETELGQTASTTGNIYGIYDMNAGRGEAVMGNIVSTDGKSMIVGDSELSNNHSGYNGLLYNGGNYISYDGVYSYPENKYVDKYSYSSSYTQINIGKLGDGSIETLISSSRSWYTDYARVPSSEEPWFGRGGNYGHDEISGVFAIFFANGQASNTITSRLTISQLN